jgi:hypothetical protein
VSDIYKVVYVKVIERCIKDLVGKSPQQRGDAIEYLHSNNFVKHCLLAGYPEGLRETLDEMIQMSRFEQQYVANQVLEKLEEA